MKVKPLSVKEYDSMIEQGILTKYDRIELLNGTIIEKMPKSPKHCAANDIVTILLLRAFDEKAVVRNQNPIWLDEFSEPEPDIVLVEPPFEKYFDKHPMPDNIFLILEISDSTLGYDRNMKGAAYARAGIRQYLLLNVGEQTLEDYRDPGADGFGWKQTYGAGQQFNLAAFPDIVLQVDDLLPTIKS